MRHAPARSLNVAAHGCAAGACTVVRCAAGFGDCDGTAANGCETNTQTSAANCGACGRACALPNATSTCAAGACAIIAACATGFADCNANPADGCEVNTRTDNANCGACGRACAAGRVCSGGVCGTTCASPLRTCGTAPATFCANTAVDPANCGACGRGCALANVAANGCAASLCTVVRCAAGFGDCDGDAANGCETNTQTSADELRRLRPGVRAAQRDGDVRLGGVRDRGVRDGLRRLRRHGGQRLRGRHPHRQRQLRRVREGLRAGHGVLGRGVRR